METDYKRTVAGSIGAGMGALINASGRTYYILEHKTSSKFHQAGESQKIIVDQIELGRDSSCQVRFDESFETVSRRHAAIVREGENWKLLPLSTTNATLVNGQVIRDEWHLHSGDEIRLSSKGPILGFIIPQGEQSLVKSIGLTERMSLFRKQALRPYKTALWILAVVLVLAIAGLVTWNILQAQNFEEELGAKQEQILGIGEKLEESNMVIEALNDELINAQEKTEAQRILTQKKLREAQEQRDALLEEAAQLRTETENAINAAKDAGKEVNAAQDQIKQLEEQMQQTQDKIQQAEEKAKAAEEAKKAEKKLVKPGVNAEPKQLSKDGSTTKLKKF